MKVNISPTTGIDVGIQNDNVDINFPNVLRTPVIYDKNYVFEQTVASDEWIIIHNLNKYPSVSIINSAGDEVIGDIHYDSFNQVTITFEGSFKGKATLN